MASFSCSTPLAELAKDQGWKVQPNSNPDNRHKHWMRIYHPTLTPKEAREQFTVLLNEYMNPQE